MRFLVDENLSPDLAEHLGSAGHDVVHVRDIGMMRATDATILEHARTEDRVLITADTDFGGLLAHTGASLPSVVLLRRLQGRRVPDQVDMLLTYLDRIEDDLAQGAIVAFDDARVRVRRLPTGQEP